MTKTEVKQTGVYNTGKKAKIDARRQVLTQCLGTEPSMEMTNFREGFGGMLEDLTYSGTFTATYDCHSLWVGMGNHRRMDNTFMIRCITI